MFSLGGTIKKNEQSQYDLLVQTGLSCGSLKFVECHVHGTFHTSLL